MGYCVWLVCAVYGVYDSKYCVRISKFNGVNNMIWDYVQLVFLLMTIAWLTFLIVVFCIVLYTNSTNGINGTKDEVISKIKVVVMMIGVIIPDVYLIGLFFWKFFQMVS